MKAYQATFPVATMCRVLDVSTSGYYAWLSRPLSKRACDDAGITERIRTIWTRSKGTFGTPRVHAELKDDGECIARKRVARLMSAGEKHGVSRRKGTFTTRRDRNARPAPDLVERNFSAAGRDQLWVADITYVRRGPASFTWQW